MKIVFFKKQRCVSQLSVTFMYGFLVGAHSTRLKYSYVQYVGSYEWGMSFKILVQRGLSSSSRRTVRGELP
jgi:hypothetical protein